MHLEKFPMKSVFMLKWVSGFEIEDHKSYFVTFFRCCGPSQLRLQVTHLRAETPTVSIKIKKSQWNEITKV